ncbi:MAG: helix-turn-helix domain-containing protein, partial [Aquisalinus sp.]|nr:helix-turn-helix domain-containing protein [Aquisalinus sp.]
MSEQSLISRPVLVDSPETESAIGARIRLSRKMKGLNQADLATRLGVSQPTVANWESGVHDPRQLM